jgi:predicted small lipoprotein YifL
MLKQFLHRALARSAVAAALVLALTACGIKGPLVPAPKDGDTAAPSPAPLIKDPAQPERRP